jgi:nicotinate-nucleotide adenylyltransferase
VAEEARARLNLSEVLFMPTGQPWLKADRNVTPAEHRVEMVRLAITERPYFKLSTMDVERHGPTYTADTLVELREKIEPGDELYFVVGWDDLAQLPQWQKPSQLVQLCFIVAVPRPGYPPPDLKSLEGIIPGLSQRVMLMDKPEIDISASEIRDRVSQGLSTSHLVPEPVNRYIKQHRLYVS